MKIFDFTKLTETVSAYIETRVELLKLDLKEQSVKFLARLLTWGIVISTALTATFFLSLGLSAFLNEVLDSTFLGYLMVACLYLLIGLITYLMRGNIEKKIHLEVKETDVLDELEEEDEQ
ncbi:MAG: phage holin family protein [Cytophagia bacterium]|nr:phage holin family protein [Cytophagia bacterium]NVK82914.1 phage holin family protein [Cytophagia bacterium]